MNTSDTQNTDTTSRPFGYWLKAVDRLMAAEFDSAFDGEHASRRDWRMLNIIDGTAPARRPLNAHKLHSLVERGWVVADTDSDLGWTLTDDGRTAKDRLSDVVDGIRAKVTDAVSPEDLDTTLTSLEQIARAFGWDEETPLPRGRGRRHGFGPRGFGRGFGPGRGFGRRHGRPFGRGRGFAPGFDSEHEHEHEHEHGADAERRGHDCGHRGHPGRDRFADAHDRAHHGHAEHGHPNHGHSDHGHQHGRHAGPRHGEHRMARAAQHAYERGFDAGFTRGRDA